MLNSLNIENYALIDKLCLDFGKGLSIITGETGAGKSILLGALSLILGNRCDTSVLKNKEKNCIVEGVFSVDGYGLESFFEENNIDYEKQITVRRIINVNGKSRAFVNEIPVTLNLLKGLGNRLLDIHSQHRNLLLSGDGFQLSVVDAIANASSELSDYVAAYNEYKTTERRLRDLEERSAKARADYDYVKYQYDQLYRAKLKEGEQEESEATINELSNIEQLKSVYDKVSNILSNEEVSIKNMLRESVQILNKLSSNHPLSRELSERLDTVLIDVRDIACEVENFYESLRDDPERLAEAENRLGLIFDLQKKHRVSTVGELIAKQSEFEKLLIDVDNCEEEYKALKSKSEAAFGESVKKSEKLTKLRKKVIPEMENHVTEMLKSLGISNAVFKIDMKRSDKYDAKGCDSVTFLFSANKDSVPQEIDKVASGGEMSRLMLALKSLLVKSIKLPSIIFDEIDTGVSGETADKTGDLIKQLSKGTQVINITHLPQIAAKGDSHYLVYKEHTDNATFTRVKRLDEKERIDEIAKMLSGSKITDTAREHARNLMG